MEILTQNQKDYLSRIFEKAWDKPEPEVSFKELEKSTNLILRDVATLNRMKKRHEADVAEIEAKRLDAKKEMDAYAALRKNAAQEEADAIVKKAHENAAREREKSVRDARREIAALASEATEKLALREAASEAFDQFLDAADAQAKEGGGKHADAAEKAPEDKGGNE